MNGKSASTTASLCTYLMPTIMDVVTRIDTSMIVLFVCGMKEKVIVVQILFIERQLT
jgi:hypothetical protein